MLKMVALDLDSVVVVLGSVWAAVLLSVLLPALPIPCANEGMLRVSARGEAARVRAREPGGGQRSEARRRGGEGGAGGGRMPAEQARAPVAEQQGVIRGLGLYSKRQEPGQCKQDGGAERQTVR